MKLRCLRHRIFRKVEGLMRPCKEYEPQCVVCQYFRRKAKKR